MRIVYLIIFILSLAVQSVAQTHGQVVRGTIVDRESKGPLPGANIIIIGSNPPVGASADANGQFRITGVKPGRYDFRTLFYMLSSLTDAGNIFLGGTNFFLDTLY